MRRNAARGTLSDWTPSPPVLYRGTAIGLSLWSGGPVLAANSWKCGTSQFSHNSIRIGAMDATGAEKAWQTLEDAIGKIYNQETCSLSLGELQTNAYHLVLQGYSGILQRRLVNTVTRHLQEISKIIESTPEEFFLKEVERKWFCHTEAMQAICLYLRYISATVLDRNEFIQLGHNLWRSHVVRSSKFRNRLIHTIGNLVFREGAGEVIDRSLIREITMMLSDIGTSVYAEDFEAPLLQCLADFYRTKSKSVLESNDCFFYMKEAEKLIFGGEVYQISEILGRKNDPSNVDNLITVIGKEVICNHRDAITGRNNGRIISMLKSGRYDDLATMYRVFQVVDSVGSKCIHHGLKQYAEETGREFVTDSENCKDPVDFVQQLLDKKDMLHKLVQHCFNDAESLHVVLMSSFEYVLNLNPRAAEFISLYMDTKLRQGQTTFKKKKLRQGLNCMSQENVQPSLEKAMGLFRHLGEKDRFENHYRKQLAERLLSGITVSDSDMESERELIAKLKAECGNEFTSKMECMVTDTTTSRHIMHGFTELLSRTNSRGWPIPYVVVRVLTAHSWPGTQSAATCNLPRELISTCHKFDDFYPSVTRQGRRLTWQTNMGTADLKTFGNRTKHLINVSTYQMCILMLFNMADRLSYGEIERATRITAHDLKRSLHSMVCVPGQNILLKEPTSNDVGGDDVFSLNQFFYSRSYKVKIITVGAHNESPETPQKVELDRKPQIDASIVRILKSRRVLDLNDIVNEVTKQFSGKFVPNLDEIKKCIDSLIKREFIETDTFQTVYRYLP